MERPALPAKDATTICAHLVGDRLEAAWVLTVRYGMRRSEVMGLRWSDIDLDAGLVHIVRGRLANGNVGTPKSDRSTRSLPITPEFAAAVRRTRLIRRGEVLAAGRSWDEEAFIAVTADLRPVAPEWYSEEWLLVCDRAGVPRVTLHSARHGSVTRMRDAGVPLHLVAAFHGHREEVSAAVYTHVEGEVLRAAVEGRLG